MMKTFIFSHSQFTLHSNGARHPERPKRLVAIEESLHNAEWWPRLQSPDFAPATRDDLLMCHTPEMIERIETLSARGGGRIDGDTAVNQHSFAAASLAVGAALAAVDCIVKKDCDNAFVASRPPGHHATSERSMGFCLFNTIGVAARHAQRAYGLERVAILDWDVHHGNGTQEIFYEDASVFFASAHQWPLYPGSGRHDEIGRGVGIGTTLNIPLSAGSGDDEYRVAWQSIEAPLREFAPQMILVSAGFDAHARDPLGGMNVSAAGFADLMRMTKSWARELCGGRLMSCLEGGYDLQGLSESVVAVVDVMQSGDDAE